MNPVYIDREGSIRTSLKMTLTFPPISGKTRITGVVTALLPGFSHTQMGIFFLLTPRFGGQLFGGAVVPTGIFFFSLGIFQLLWVAVMAKSSNRALIVLGMLGSLGSVIIYFVSVMVALPFGVPRQPLTPTAIETKALESVFILVSFYMFWGLSKATRVS